MPLLKRTILIAFFCMPLLLPAQSKEKKEKESQFIREYFTIDPESLSPDEIIQKLKKNMQLTIDSLRPHTDTSFMYIKAHSTGYNPFGISIKKLELIFVESALYSTRQKRPLDTILTLRITGVTDSTESSKHVIKDEFKRINKILSDLSELTFYNEPDKKSKLYSESYNYFSGSLLFPKLILTSEVYYPDKKTYCISLEIKLAID